MVRGSIPRESIFFLAELTVVGGDGGSFFSPHTRPDKQERAPEQSCMMKNTDRDSLEQMSMNPNMLITELRLYSCTLGIDSTLRKPLKPTPALLRL